MDELELQKKATQWETALSSAMLNNSCLGATLTISKQKMQLQKLQRHYLVGQVTLSEQNSICSVSPAKWEDKCREKMLKHQNEYDQNIKKLTKKFMKRKIDIQNEIDKANKRIEDSKRFIQKSKLIIEQDIPDFDYDAIGNIYDLKAKIKESKKIIEDMKYKLNQYNVENETRRNNPLSLNEIIASPPPFRIKTRFQNRNFDKL